MDDQTLPDGPALGGYPQEVYAVGDIGHSKFECFAAGNLDRCDDLLTQSII